MSDLERVVGDGNVRSRPAELTPYGRDATPLYEGSADVVVLPGSTAEVAAVVQVAKRRGLALIPRGAGTNLAAATVPVGGGIVMSLTRMNQVLEINRGEMLAVVQPGVTTAELGSAADRLGLFYPPDPGSRETCTIGGNIATNAGGLRGLKYGVTRDYVLGLELVLASGETIRTGGRLIKDVAGYDLTRLIVGSEGTLAVVTEATVALRPRPEASITGVAYFPELAQAAAAVDAILAAGILPATLEFLNDVCIGVVEDYAQLGLRRDAGALLLFGDDGTAASARLCVERMAEICRDGDALEITTASQIAEAEDLLAARRCTLPALARVAPITILEDVAVPRPRLVEMVEAVAEITQELGLACGTFGHAGDGNLHPTLLLERDDELARQAAEQAVARIFAKAIELGGTISGEHGIGLTKKSYLGDQLGAEHLALLRRVKTAFDPSGILNPTKLGS